MTNGSCNENTKKSYKQIKKTKRNGSPAFFEKLHRHSYGFKSRTTAPLYRLFICLGCLLLEVFCRSTVMVATCHPCSTAVSGTHIKFVQYFCLISSRPLRTGTNMLFDIYKNVFLLAVLFPETAHREQSL